MKKSLTLALVLSFLALPFMANTADAAKKPRPFSEIRENVQNMTEEERREYKESGQAQADIVAKLSQFMDSVIARMETRKNKINGSENIDDETKAEMIAHADEMITIIVAKKSEIETATGEELRALIQDVRNTLKTHHRKGLKHAAKNHAKRLDSGVNRMDSFVSKIKTKAEELAAAGHDVEELNEAILDLEVGITEAKAKMADAKASFEAAQASDEPKALIEEGKSLMKEAHKMMKEAHAEFKEEMKELREEQEEDSDE